MLFGAPLSPIERLKKVPAPPRSICRATTAPMVNRPSPGWAAIAMILAGFVPSVGFAHADEGGARAENIAAPPADCAKERRFILSPSLLLVFRFLAIFLRRPPDTFISVA